LRKRADRVAFRVPAKPPAAYTPPFSAKAKVASADATQNQRTSERNDGDPNDANNQDVARIFKAATQVFVSIAN
jgi:hypothetical protein